MPGGGESFNAPVKDSVTPACWLLIGAWLFLRRAGGGWQVGLQGGDVSGQIGQLPLQGWPQLRKGFRCGLRQRGQIALSCLQPLPERIHLRKKPLSWLLSALEGGKAQLVDACIQPCHGGPGLIHLLLPCARRLILFLDDGRCWWRCGRGPRRLGKHHHHQQRV